jgi:hypothetical protein
MNRGGRYKAACKVDHKGFSWKDKRVYINNVYTVQGTVCICICEMSHNHSIVLFLWIRSTHICDIQYVQCLWDLHGVKCCPNVYSGILCKYVNFTLLKYSSHNMSRLFLVFSLLFLLFFKGHVFRVWRTYSIQYFQKGTVQLKYLKAASLDKPATGLFINWYICFTIYCTIAYPSWDCPAVVCHLFLYSFLCAPTTAFTWFCTLQFSSPNVFGRLRLGTITFWNSYV